MVNLANLITIGRLIAVPFIVWLLVSQNHAMAFWLFVAAGISDGIDGYLAKHWGMATTLGRYLDPVADKALLVSIYVTLGWQGYLPSWLVLMVASRDVLIIGAIVISGLMGHDLEIRPTPVSKLNTVVQIRAGGLDPGAFRLRFFPGCRYGGLDVDLVGDRDRAAFPLSLSRDLAVRHCRHGGRAMSARKYALFWLGAIVLFGLMLWALAPVLLPFVVGMAIAYLLDPVVDWMERHPHRPEPGYRHHHGRRRGSPADRAGRPVPADPGPGAGAWPGAAGPDRQGRRPPAGNCSTTSCPNSPASSARRFRPA